MLIVVGALIFAATAARHTHLSRISAARYVGYATIGIALGTACLLAALSLWPITGGLPRALVKIAFVSGGIALGVYVAHRYPNSLR